MTNGFKLYKNGRFKDALDIFLNMKMKNDHAKDLDRCIAMTLLRMKKYNLAQLYFESALRRESFTKPLMIAGTICNQACLYSSDTMRIK